MAWRKQLHKSAIQSNWKSIRKSRGGESCLHNYSINLDWSNMVSQVVKNVNRSADLDSESEGHFQVCWGMWSQ